MQASQSYNATNRIRKENQNSAPIVGVPPKTSSLKPDAFKTGVPGGIKLKKKDMIIISKERIENLKSKVKGQIGLRNNSSYEEVCQIWNAMFERRSALIVRCAEARDRNPLLNENGRTNLLRECTHVITEINKCNIIPRIGRLPLTCNCRLLIAALALCDLARFLKETSAFIRLRLSTGWFVAIGLVVFPLLAPAHGGSGGMGSGGHGQSHGEHYLSPFWSPWYSGSGSYDVGYMYTYAPSPEQQSIARKRIKDYLLTVQKGERPPTRRYVSVETLRPTKAQSADYLKKRAQRKAPAPEPVQLHCLMVFDTQAKQFVGSGCYVVERLPTPGAVTKFESASAEFVAQGAL